MFNRPENETLKIVLFLVLKISTDILIKKSNKNTILSKKGTLVAIISKDKRNAYL
jgi:hypothetical protein